MTLRPQEEKYFAEQEMVQIIPRFDAPLMFLVSGDCGPFMADQPAFVPLWAAMYFRERSQCTLIPPTWMRREELTKILEAERKSNKFTKMPSEHYMAIAKMIFETCPQDVPEAEEVKGLIRDLWDSRMKKLRKDLVKYIEVEADYALVPNLTQGEICSIPPCFLKAYDELFRVQKESRVALTKTAEEDISDSELEALYCQPP